MTNRSLPQTARNVLLGLLLWGGWLLSGCNTAVPRPLPTPILPAAAPTRAPSPTAPIAPSPTPQLDTGWLPLQTGLEQRILRLFDAEGQQIEEITLLRVDPAHFAFQVAYSPGAPRTLPAWQAETGALLVVNGGFFTEMNTATGLVIVDGAASGVSYSGFGGMLAIDASGPQLRALAERPYAPDEPLTYALQSFPLLVRPGGQLGYPEEDGQRARRTVIAQDGDGRFLFIVAPWGSFTLHELSRWLVNGDLDLAIALNLDGGASSGLLLANSALNIPSFTAVPAVIALFPRTP